MGLKRKLMRGKVDVGEFGTMYLRAMSDIRFFLIFVDREQTLTVGKFKLA